MARPHPATGTGTSQWDTHLEDAVHDDGQRAVPRVLGHFEHIQPPLVGVLQLLGSRGTEIHEGLVLGTPRSGGSPLPGPTLASSASRSVRTPKRGMPAAASLEPCLSFLTPLICDMGRFLCSFSLSFASAEGISTSCCLSGVTRGGREHQFHCQHPPRVTLRTGTGHTVTIRGAAVFYLTPIHTSARNTPTATQGWPQQPQCTSTHQYEPALPARKNAVTPPRQQIPLGHPRNAPPAPPIPFLHKKQVGPSAGITPVGTPALWGHQGHPAASGEVTLGRGAPHPGRCWRCTRRPGSRSGWSPRGASAPGSASA